MSAAQLPGTVRVSESVLWQRVGDEVVLLDLAAGEYHGLNDVGGEMWIALDECHDVAAALQRLHGTYEVEEQVLRDDLVRFIDKLVAGGLLVTP